MLASLSVWISSRENFATMEKTSLLLTGFRHFCLCSRSFFNLGIVGFLDGGGVQRGSSPTFAEITI